MNQVEIDGARIAVSDTGTGRPVVMLHCSAASGSAWRDVSRWMGPGLRSVAPDLYGCGTSAPWRRLRPLRLDDHVGAVETVVARLGEPVDLVGHSFGGAVALRAAMSLQRQGLLQSLTVIEPTVFHLLRGGRAGDRHLYGEVAALAGDIHAAHCDNDAARGMGRFVDYWNGPGSWARLNADAQARLASRLELIVEDFAVLFADATTLDAYGFIKAPTMIISATHSPKPAQRICALLSVAIPGAEQVIISAGHMAPHTHPAVIGSLIASHLEYSGWQRRQVA